MLFVSCLLSDGCWTSESENGEARPGPYISCLNMFLSFSTSTRFSTITLFSRFAFLFASQRERLSRVCVWFVHGVLCHTPTHAYYSIFFTASLVSFILNTFIFFSLFICTQAVAREKLDKIREANESNTRKELEMTISDLKVSCAFLVENISGM